MSIPIICTVNILCLSMSIVLDCSLANFYQPTFLSKQHVSKSSIDFLTVNLFLFSKRSCTFVPLRGCNPAMPFWHYSLLKYKNILLNNQVRIQLGMFLKNIMKTNKVFKSEDSNCCCHLEQV